jgi:hypothetical protein
MVSRVTASVLGAGLGGDVYAAAGAALFALLFVLLLIRELLRVAAAERFARIRPALDLAIVPGLVAFCLLVGSRAIAMLRG